MAYVDLNPIRAGIAKTPEDSEFTSIYDRIRALSADTKPMQKPLAMVPLRAFIDEVAKNEPAIPYTFRDYLALVGWSGRMIRNDKCGAIDPEKQHTLGHAPISRVGALCGRLRCRAGKPG